MSYNGWTNYETWNIMLWLFNDERYYPALLDYARHVKDTNDIIAYYTFFSKWLGFSDFEDKNSDGVKWHDTRVSRQEFRQAVKELIEEME